MKFRWRFFLFCLLMFFTCSRIICWADHFIFIPLSKSSSCRCSLLVPWQLSVLLPVLYYLDYCSDIRSLKIMKYTSYELFPSFYTLFYGNSFVFPQNFENQFAYIYKKNPAGNVTETSINLLIKWRRWFSFYQFYLL